MKNLVLSFLLVFLLVFFISCAKEDVDRPDVPAVVEEAAADPVAGDRKVVEIEGIEVALRFIPPGTFIMGSPEDEPDRNAECETQHEVEITKGFWMSETVITDILYEAVMGENPSEVKTESLTDITGTLPVTNVDWEDAQAFVEKLSEMTGQKWEMPTEAEWEYAARAGTTTTYYWGDEGEEEAISKYEVYRAGIIQPVGQLEPNPWGLYDMLGNTWEWVYDWYKPYDQYAGEDGVIPKRIDPRQSERTAWHQRTRRGTHYTRRRAQDFRVARRAQGTPTSKGAYGSFRIVLRD